MTKANKKNIISYKVIFQLTTDAPVIPDMKKWIAMVYIIKIKKEANSMSNIVKKETSGIIPKEIANITLEELMSTEGVELPQKE